MNNNEIEPLSLETFDPVYAREPYLNTPRSLRACQEHGINPEELVEIPFREFQRAYPDDPETALRKFERVDGARKRVLEEVVKTWKIICQQEAKHPKIKELPSDAEVVIKVDPEAYSKRLELQAQHFRKTEKKQFKALQTMVFTEMKKAVLDQLSKRIIQKQNNMEEIKKRQRREHELAVEQKHRLEREEIDAKEREWQKEIKQAQKEYLDSVKMKSELEKENSRREKLQQLKRETERVQREEYFKKQKESNTKRFQREAIERSQQLNMREQEISERLEMDRRRKESEHKIKKLSNTTRLTKAKDELNKMESEKKEFLTSKIDAFDKQFEDRKQWKLEQHQKHLEERGDFYSDKLKSIRENSDQKLKLKVEKILSELEEKEQKAQNELNRVEYERERRKAIKDVRDEAHELSATRRKKAEEFRKQRIMENIKKKNDRYQAIKDGEKTLRSMTDKIAEVMSKTKAEIRTEALKLNAKDKLTPDTVLETIKIHSDKVLFPRLENRFGDTIHSENNTQRPNTTINGSQSLGTPNTRAHTATTSIRPKSPPPAIQLKIFSKEKLEESLQNIKNTVETVAHIDSSTPLSARNESEESKKKDKTKNKKNKKTKYDDDYDGEGDGDDESWLFDEDASPLQHISKPKNTKRVYKRQTTPYPEEISATSLEKNYQILEQYKQLNQDSDLVEGEPIEEGYTQSSLSKNNKSTRINHTAYYYDEIYDDNDDSEKKVQFVESTRPHTDPIGRRESFKTRKKTPYPHEIEESNIKSELILNSENEDDNRENHEDDHNHNHNHGYHKSHSADEINQRKNSFQVRKHTPFPHEIQEELEKQRKYQSHESISEDQEQNNDEINQYVYHENNPEYCDTEFDNYRKEKQNNNSRNGSLLDNLDSEELGYQQKHHNHHQQQQQKHSQKQQQKQEHYNKSRQSSSRNNSNQYDGSQSLPTPYQNDQHYDGFSNTSSSTNKKSRNVRLRPITPEGHFRREFSKDHPFAGGSGKYKKEVSQGKDWMGPKAYNQKPVRISEIVSKQERNKLELQKQLEELRKHQNEVLLEVLEEERKAEMERVELGRNVNDSDERRRLELVFAEERKRASERIISLTKLHEQKMKEVIIAMDLGG